VEVVADFAAVVCHGGSFRAMCRMLGRRPKGSLWEESVTLRSRAFLVAECDRVRQGG
jgi:hypothetical protein